MRFERILKDVVGGQHWRLRLEFNSDFELATVAEERVTSGRDLAQVLEGTTLELSDEQLDFMTESLLELRELRRAERQIADAPAYEERPANDVPIVSAQALVARDAKVVHRLFHDGSPQDLADAIGTMGESLAILGKSEGRKISVVARRASGSASP